MISTIKTLAVMLKIAAALGWLATAIVACASGERIPPAPSVYANDENAPIGTGGLEVRVVGGPKYEPESNADVSLYASLDDYHADVYLGRIVTGRNGRADFGYLNAGNYYVYVRKQDNGKEYQSLEAAQVQLARSLTRNIILR
jgi:hypothetical protein